MRWLLSFAILLCASCAQSGYRSFPERKTQQLGAFTIEYSAGDEAHANLLANLLRVPKLNSWSAKPSPLSLADLKRRREYFLGRLAAVLGQSQPSPLAVAAYDGFLQGFSGRAAMDRPTRYALWRRGEVLARLKAGQAVFGFRANGERAIDFGLHLDLEQPPPVNATAKRATEALGWPITVDDAKPEPPAQQISEELDEIEHVQPQVGEVIERGSVFLVLHEAAEVGIIETYLRSPDRRWFCDGVANYVAMRLIAAEVGTEEAKSYYDLDALLRTYAPLASRIDLVNWPALEDVAKTGYADNPGGPEYVFATKVIADICAKHGDDLLPRLFREIGRTEQRQTTMATVYVTFSKLTGEDMRSYLPKPAKGGPAALGGAGGE